MSVSLKSLVLLSLLMFTNPVALAAVNRTSLSPCEVLSQSLPGKVYYPNSTLYTLQTDSYYFLEGRLSPSCLVLPQSSADVAESVKILTRYPADDQSLFAIRSGGMSPNINSSNINTGVTIDLFHLNSFSLSSDCTVVSVGAGATSGDAYKFLDPYGLGIPAGRISTSGLGGLMTGGGLSTFSPRLGFSCDSVLNFEVVLASGRIVQANETSYPDLFTALKGGSNNFGIVTQMDIATFPQGKYWGGAIEYPEATEAAQLKAVIDFRSFDHYDPYAESELSFLYESATNSFFIANNMFYTKPIINATGLKPFTSIQPQLANTMRISNSSDFAEEIRKDAPYQEYGILASTTLRASLPLLTKLHALWKSSTGSLHNVTDLLYNFDIQGVPQGIAGASNSLGAPANPQDLVILLLTNFWTRDSDSRLVQQATKALMDRIEAEIALEDAGLPFKYLNYASVWQDPLSSYGTQNFDNLRKVSKRYDPYSLFQNRVPGGFKLFSD